MSTPPLKITIIGAGIAGLTTALALLRTTPHHITLLEKSLFTTPETGAAMYVGPNASVHLLRLGWDPVRTRAIPCEGVLSIWGPTGEVRNNMALEGVRKQWASPWLLVHRGDLHGELMGLVKEGGVDVRLGVRIVEVDAESGRVVLDDGTVFESDAIVGADGNNSIARKSVDPGAVLRPWGKSCYRFLVGREVLKRDEETRGLVEEDGYFLDVLANDRKFVAYPCRNNTEVNVAAFLPDEELGGSGDDWEQQGNKTKMMNGFAGFYPAARKSLSYADEDLKVWQLVDMDQLKQWNKGRLALIGDAAHPFLPFLGQGAAQAIEDAISVAKVLQPGTKASDVPELLKLYDGIRRERVDYVQEQTRLNGLDEDKGRPPPSALFGMLDYCHKHDEWTNTEQKLQEWRQGRANESNGVNGHS
ncbi:hypothetical protein PRZ48_011516 [Zasmidium cellare]|uniref:FAD-binding domain-containing protein n=1 Tax=Zasmidium cellare TaxID=395010 RepID=A0ABR0E6K6_ZASCE|nr:hypothetical protein PRZ48_011516 [Zasmidium cellare]